MTNNDLKIASGSVESDDKLVAFLYFLLRDKIPAGELEAIMRQVEDFEPPWLVMSFSNGWLAQYAINLAGRLARSDVRTISDAPIVGTE